MKKTILIIALIIATVQIAFSQNAIAKLKFEEAEEAYTVGNYDLTLNKLKEVETLLKSTNPKVLHLKILVEDKLIHEPIFNNDIKQIAQLKSDCDFYLTKYETIENNEDKYKEVYKISEAVKVYKFDENRYNNAIENYLGNAINLYQERKLDEFTASLEKIALKGNSKAIITLGQYYEGALNDYVTAAKWFQIGASNDETTCIVLLGNLYKTGGKSFPKNTEMAISLYTKAVDLGDISGVVGLITLYTDGETLPVNEAASLEWLNKAEKIKPKTYIDSSSFGQVHIVMCKAYFEGKGFEKNYAKVVDYANKGIQNSANAQAGELFGMLGMVYKLGGYGIAQDYLKAFNSYKASADKNDFNGMIQLADLYKMGLGTKKDKNKALELSGQVVTFYEQYAKEGSLFCMTELVNIYEKGIGCDVNPSKANYWKQKATEQKAKETK